MNVGFWNKFQSTAKSSKWVCLLSILFLSNNCGFICWKNYAIKSVDIISGQLLVNGWDVTWEIIQNVKPWTIKTKARVSHWIKKRVKNRSLGASGLFQWRINELMLEHFRYGRSSEKWKKRVQRNRLLIYVLGSTSFLLLTL